MLPDVYGEPALILRVDLSRDIYREGQTSMMYLLLAFLIVGSIAAGGFWWLLNNVLIARLARLDDDVNEIGRQGDVTARLSVSGGDELSSLGRSINDMLEALERAHYELKESEEKFRSFVQQSVDGVFLTDQRGRFTLWNRAQEQIMGLEQSEVLGQPLWDVQFRLLPEHELDESRREQIETGVRQFFGGDPATWVRELHEQEIQRPDGTRRIVQSLTFPIKMAHGYRIGGISRDVTERVRAQQALRASKELFEKTFRSQRAAIFILDADRPPHIVDCNRAAWEIFGYPREEMLGRTTAFLHVDEAALQAFQAAIYPDVDAQGFARLSQFRMKRQDGTVFFTDHAVTVLQDERDQRTGWVSVVHDVTERVQAERALRESEARYRLLFNSGNDMVFVTTLTAEGMPGQVIEANEEAYRRMGYAKEELVGVSLVEFAAPEKRHNFLDLGQQFLTEKSILFETVGVTRQGARIPLEVNAQMFDLHGQPAVLSVARDITERKQTEMALSQRLLEQESLFVITQLVSSTLRVDEVMQVVVEQMAHLVNASGCVILEWNPESGLLTSRAKYIRPEYKAPGAPLQSVEASCDLRDYPAKGVSLREQEPFVAYVDDEQADRRERDLLEREGWYGVVGIPLFVQDQALGLVQVYLAYPDQALEKHDIRLLQTLANQVAVTIQNARLFEALQGREANLRDLSRRLINVQERERRHIAQELHDELGQILTATKINIDLARRKFSQMALETDALTRLQSRLDEASDLTDRVLTSVRTMTVELRPTLLDDMGIVPTLRWYVGRFADRTGIRVQLKVPELPARLVPEIETAIYRGVQEALTNVARHAHADEVYVRLAFAGDLITASIEDDGRGFDVQAWADSQGWQQSLGLAGIQERVNLLDGYVNVISQPGEGTRIEMALPARFQPEDVKS
jgi:PAS domain S-box-containing protein